VAEAQKVLEEDPGFYKAYLPLAMAALASGDAQAAIGHYGSMSETGPSGESLATLGLADVAIHTGKLEEATTLLLAGIGRDREAGKRYDLGHKSIALAAVYASQESFAPAGEALKDALDHSRAEAIVFPAARLLIQLGREADARHIAEELGRELQPQDRAYGKLIEGMLAMAGGNPVEAIERIQASIELADLWLARFHLGIVYLEAGYAAEALSEFELCETRIGEAASLFLDDFPTWRYTAPLGYWKARAQEAIGITPAAISGYQAFLALRPETSEDPLAVDARQRLQTLAGDSP
jgi:tetratricopeptide (TPR) repeat protein